MAHGQISVLSDTGKSRDLYLGIGDGGVEVAFGDISNIEEAILKVGGEMWEEVFEPSNILMVDEKR